MYQENKTMQHFAELISMQKDIENELVVQAKFIKQSGYAKFHANQSLLLLITGVAGNVILGIIPVVGWMLMPIFGIGILILGIMDLINGFGGKAKPLPLIGKFTILK